MLIFALYLEEIEEVRTCGTYTDEVFVWMRVGRWFGSDFQFLGTFDVLADLYSSHGYGAPKDCLSFKREYCTVSRPNKQAIIQLVPVLLFSYSCSSYKFGQWTRAQLLKLSAEGLHLFNGR